jgi:hypothetical protein
MTVAGDTAVRGEGLEWVGAAVPASGDAGDGEWRPTRAMEEESKDPGRRLCLDCARGVIRLEDHQRLIAARLARRRRKLETLLTALAACVNRTMFLLAHAED